MAQNAENAEVKAAILANIILTTNINAKFAVAEMILTAKIIEKKGYSIARDKYLFLILNLMFV